MGQTNMRDSRYTGYAQTLDAAEALLWGEEPEESEELRISLVFNTSEKGLIFQPRGSPQGIKSTALQNQ